MELKNPIVDIYFAVLLILLLLFTPNLISIMKIPVSVLPNSQLFTVPSESGQVSQTILLDKSLQITDPQSQIHSWREGLLFGLVLSILVYFVVSFRFVLIARKKEWRVPTLSILQIVSLSVFFATLVLLMVHDGYDETYLFVTQVESFRNGNLNSVPIFGDSHFAEASADVFSIVVAGVLGFIARWLHSETLIIISGVLGGISVVLYMFFNFIRNSKYQFVSILVVFLVIFSPPFLGAISNGFPTTWTALACLIAVHVISSPHKFLWIGINLRLILVFAIRPEVGLIAIIFLFFRLFGSHYAMRQSLVTNISNIVKSTWLANLSIAGWSLFRFFHFGGLFPSGITGKNVGIKRDFIDSGFRHLLELENLAKSFSLFVFMASILFLLRSRIGTWGFLSSLLFSVTIFSTAVVSGGDWFPAFWQRYTLPITAALMLFVFSHFLYLQVELRNRLLVAVVVPFLIFQWSLASLSGGIDRISPSRSSCLATFGEELSTLLAPDSGLGTPELNTIGFFSKQPVVDLMGIVDPEIAAVRSTPLSYGDILHRKNSVNLLSKRMPGALYLYSDSLDGVDCGNGVIASADNVNRLNIANSFLSSNRVKFRAGSTVFISKNYSAVFIGRGQGSPRALFWVRNDLIPDMSARAVARGYEINVE